MIMTPKLVAEDFVKKTNGAAARFFDRRLATRQSKLPQMSDAVESVCVSPQEFSAPNRAVAAVTSPIPRNTQYRRAQFILRHARNDVRPMMLHVTNGNGKLCSVFRRQIIGMHVAGDSVNPS